jgi:hypothetical protein
MIMDRALVVVLVKAVASGAVWDLVLVRGEATEEASAGVEFTLPPEEGMVQPTMPLMRVLTP